MNFLIPLSFLAAGLLLPSIRTYRSFLLASYAIFYALGVSCLVFILKNPDQIPSNYPWLWQNVNLSDTLSVIILAFIFLLFSAFIPCILSSKIGGLLPPTIILAFATKEIKPVQARIVFSALILISLSSYIYLSGGFFNAISEAWLIRRGLRAADITFASLKLLLSAIAFNASAIWLIFAINSFIDSSTKPARDFLFQPAQLVKLLGSANVLTPMLLSLVSGAVMAGRGNTIQFIEVWIFCIAIKCSKFQWLFLYNFIHYSLSNAGAVYYRLRSFLVGAEIQYSQSLDVVYEPPARIANEFVNLSTLFRINAHSHILWGNESVNPFRPGEYFTGLVKGYYQIHEWDSSQPFSLLDSFLAIFGILGIPLSVLIAAICISIPDQIGRKRRLFKSDGIYVALLYISFNSVRPVLVSPGFGSIVLQTVLVPLLLLITILFCSRQQASPKLTTQPRIQP